MEAGERSGWGDWREGVGEGSQEGVCGYVQSAECGAECGVQGAWGSLCVCVAALTCAGEPVLEGRAIHGRCRRAHPSVRHSDSQSVNGRGKLD